MGLFRKSKKEAPFNQIKKYCKDQNIHISYFYGWHNHIGNPPLTDELVQEFINRPHLLHQTELRITLILPETETKIRGGMLNGSGFNKSIKEQLEVKCRMYIAKKGLVFVKAINNSEDLRIAWEDITEVMQEKKKCIIVCDTVRYVVKCGSDDTAVLLCDFIQGNMCGEKEDGWD